MSKIRLFGLTPSGVHELAVPENVKGINDLYEGMPLGVYSALRTYEKTKFLGLDDHITRTKRSIALLGWRDSLDEQLLRSGLNKILSEAVGGDFRVRFDVLAEPILFSGNHTRLLVATEPFDGIPDDLYRQGVKVGFAASLIRETPLIKTAEFVDQRKAFPIGTHEIYERLLIDEAGNILECTSANFYAVINGRILTAAEGILEGVTRKIILEVVRQLEIPLELIPPRVDDIHQFDEAGLSSSSRALIPIVQIGTQVIGNGQPGPIMTKISEGYQQLIEQRIKPAI